MSILSKFVALSKYATCPYCGHTVNSCNNGSVVCSGCKKSVVFQDGEVVGWR